MSSALQQAQYFRERGDYADALRIVNQLLATERDPAVVLEHGRIYAELNDRAQARADFEAVSFADPTGELGDQARRELLRLITPPPMPQPIRYRTQTRREPPNKWALRMVLFIVVLSVICSLLMVGSLRDTVQQRITAPTPTLVR